MDKKEENQLWDSIIFSNRNNPIEKLKDLKALITYNKNLEYVYFLIADSYWQLGKTTKAETYYNLSLKQRKIGNYLPKVGLSKLILSKNKLSQDILQYVVSLLEEALQDYKNYDLTKEYSHELRDKITKTEVDTRIDILMLLYEAKIRLVSLESDKIKDLIRGERNRTVQIVSIFTAAISIIFANVNWVSNVGSPYIYISFNLSLIASLIVFLWLTKKWFL